MDNTVPGLLNFYKKWKGRRLSKEGSSNDISKCMILTVPTIDIDGVYVHGARTLLVVYISPSELLEWCMGLEHDHNTATNRESMASNTRTHTHTQPTQTMAE